MWWIFAVLVCTSDLSCQAVPLVYGVPSIEDCRELENSAEAYYPREFVCYQELEL